MFFLAEFGGFYFPIGAWYNQANNGGPCAANKRLNTGQALVYVFVVD